MIAAVAEAVSNAAALVSKALRVANDAFLAVANDILAVVEGVGAAENLEAADVAVAVVSGVGIESGKHGRGCAESSRYSHQWVPPQ